MGGKEILRQFWDAQAAEAKAELAQQGENDYLNTHKLTEFVSTSKGRGRQRARPTEIMVITTAAGTSYFVKADVPHNSLDTTAELAAGCEYRGMSAWEWFIHKLRTRGLESNFHIICLCTDRL